MFELYLRQLSKSYRDVRPSLEDDLLNPDEIRVYEKIWGVEQNKFVFYHADLAPTNIKVMVDEDGTANVTALLDWEIARYFPRGWISTEPHVSGGIGFDWNGEPGEMEWGSRLRIFLEAMGYPSSADRWSKWIYANLEIQFRFYAIIATHFKDLSRWRPNRMGRLNISHRTRK